MAIVQYSKIKVRRGLTADLPNPLEPSEIGHAVDQRRLFIGNGPIVDGAPTVGNTEILTEFSENSDIISYTYKSNIGVEAVTGPTANSPIVRSLQQVLDDRLSIKAYGALGDGLQDDSVDLNRAMQDVYTIIIPSGAQEQEYRAIYLPAGEYMMDQEDLKLPPYSILIGDGIGKTIIRMIDTGNIHPSVVQTADSLFQTDLQLGNGGATLPTNIAAYGISFVHDLDKNVINLNRASNILFDTCSFTNGWISGSSSSSLIYLDPIGGVYTHSNIKFKECEFTGGGSVANLDAAGLDANGILFENSRILNSYQGIIANNVSGDTIKGVKVLNTHFENVTKTAIYAGPYSEEITSSTNTFINCGDIGSPVIVFDGTGGNTATNCSSVNDVFELLPNIISISNLSKSCLSLNPQTDFIFKNIVITSKSDPFTLQPGQTNTATDISFDSTLTDSMFIDYTLKRNGFSRIGRIFVATDGTLVGTTLADLFNESDTTGITFDFSLAGPTLTVVYSSISVIAIGTVVNPTVTPGHTLTINGTLVTFTGSSLASVITDITTAAIPFLTATNDEDRLGLFLSNGPTITISGTGTAMTDLGLVALYSSTSGDFHHQQKSWSML